MLELRNIQKSYDQLTVLKNISFKIEKGSFISLVGLSGSGKTTLLKIIASLLEPDAGEVLLNKTRLIGPKNKLLAGYEEIKLVFQDFALKQNMTVEENLNYALLGFEDSYKKDRVAQLISLCGLGELHNRKPQELSGGQQQRVAFSRALVTEPEIILMDEPFSNLDPLTKHELLQETKRLARQTDTSIVLVTHDTRDAMEAADEIFVLHDGLIVQRGSPISIYQSPKSPDVAKLFGLINILNRQQSLSLFNLDKAIGIWAEDLKIVKNGSIKGKVERVVFAGGFHKLNVKVNAKLDLVVIDHTKNITEGQQIKLEVATENIITFQN